MKFCQIALWAIMVVCTESAKILFTAMPQGRSHINSMLPLARRLSKEGHEVSIFYEIFRPELPLDSNLKDAMIFMTSENFIVDDDPKFIDIVWNGEFNALGMFFPQLSSVLALNHLLTNQTRDFYHLANQSWDLVVEDTLFDGTGMALGYLNKKKYGKPYILFQTTMAEPMITYHKQAHAQWAFVPVWLPHEDPNWSIDNFSSRLRSFKDGGAFFFMYSFLFEWMMRYVMRPIWPGFSYHEWATEDSLAPCNYPNRLDWVMPSTREFLYIGAYCKPWKALSEELETFVNDPESEGTILIAFGTIVRWDMAPERAIDAVVETMREMKEYRFLWGLHSNVSGESWDRILPKNVKTSNWLPQVDILNHPKTKLFVSHGGLKSLTEAICAEKPVVYVPMFAEQIRNSLLARRWGFGEYLNKKTLNSKESIAMFRKVINNSSYYNNVKRAKAIWMDRPYPALEEAVFWLNKIIRNEGLPQKYYKHKEITSWRQHLYLELVLGLLFCTKFMSG